MTYEELDKRSDALAAVLQSRHVQSNDVIALLADRSIETIIGMLAILKAGGAYLPIDVDYPKDRIDYLINDSGTKLLVTLRGMEDRITQDKPLPVVFIDDCDQLNCFEHPAKTAIKPGDLCYVIYTSGTTGRPKGVMLEHRNVVRLLFNEQFQFDFNDADVWTMFHSHCFDFSVWEMYGALLFGGRLVIIPKKIAADAPAFLATLKQEGVTVLNQTPGAFYNLVREETAISGNQLALRYVIFGGEALIPGKLLAWHNKYPQTRLVNMYGITETTVHVTYKEIRAKEIANNISNIGTPIPTLSAYVFNNDMQLVPKGIIGELYIGGAGLCRGYLGQPALTASKFINNPYRATERLYKSGDLARVLANGELEYLGRSDDQVKIRGFRIELGEISFQLSQYPSITDATTVTIINQGEKYLGAYYVSPNEIKVSVLRDFLSCKLPDYMVPTYFMRVGRIPLTSNGKVDKKALPELHSQTEKLYEGASNATEFALLAIWSDVLQLKKENISVTRSFFELGGHSLKAAVLVNRISKALDAKISLKDIFRFQTIREQAGLIGSSSKEVHVCIPKAPKRDSYTLSSAQRRMYFLYHMDPSSLAYNMPRFISLKGALDFSRLQEAFTALVARHECLRTIFRVVDEVPCQQLLAAGSLQLKYTVEKDWEKAAAQFVIPFDLQKGPLFRAGIVSAGSDHHLLAIDMHHIITDGVSNEILIEDFISLYNGNVLPENNLQYKDYAQWQQSDAQQNEIEKQKQYWINVYAEELTALELPADNIRPAEKSFAGENFDFTLEADLCGELRKIAEREGVTLYMLLFTVYSILLGKLGDTEDLVIGTPVAGREHTDLDRMVGMFANTLPLRNYPCGNKYVLAYLQETKNMVLQGFDNQTYQYEDLINALKIERDPGRNPLFDVLFSYNNFGNQELLIPGIEAMPYHYGDTVAKFDLTLTAIETPTVLKLRFDFCTALFEKETIAGFAACFTKIAAALTNAENLLISDIRMLNPAEEQAELFGNNDTEAYYPSDKTLIALLEDQVSLTPDTIALRCANSNFTFKQFSNTCSSVAAYLINEGGVSPGDLVGILLEREEYMLLSIYGVLKAGAAYVPIDPHFPPDRINTIIATSGMKTLITRKRYYENGISINGRLVDLDTCEDQARKYVAGELPWKTQSSDALAYVIYTSGSTGIPKGVMVSHHSVVNRLYWMQKQYPLTEKDIILQKTPVVFDVSVWELFWWFFAGCSLALLKPGGEKEPEELVTAIEQNKITVLHFVPSMLQAFLFHIENKQCNEQLSSISIVFASGEALRPEHVKQFGKNLHTHNNTRLVNLYGPTEATVDVSYYEINFADDNKVIPIGKPIDNTRLYILDKTKRPVPQGVRGELFIAGVGLAKGYLGNEQLTNEKFVTDPWHKGALMYHTGDVVRRNKNGDIEYIGRNDFQVKLRGFRIDCGDIESHILQYGAVKEAVVLLKERSGEKYLVAYYVSPAHEDEDALRRYLSEKLPPYMVPSYFLPLNELPLTISGKLDRKALPDAVISAAAECIRPVNQVQKDLVAIWAEVLSWEPDQISVNDNFFTIGGNSLSLIRLTSRINQHFNTNISVASIFRYPIISSIAEFLSNPVGTVEDTTLGMEEDYAQMNEAIELLNQN